RSPRSPRRSRRATASARAPLAARGSARTGSAGARPLRSSAARTRSPRRRAPAARARPGSARRSRERRSSRRRSTAWAARRPRPWPGLADQLDVEERVDELALLVVRGFRVDGPDVVVRAVEQVERGEDRGPHRVVLVVVAVEAVAAERLQVLEPGQVAVQDGYGLAVVAVVHRIGLGHAHLDAVAD